jgi:chromosome partitioning protein
VSAPPSRVVAVVSNKGGVGKTTVATNLAIYMRALREDLPVLLVGLDDQSVVDRMFALEPIRPDEPNLKHAWAERTLERAIRVGQYGVHFVPSPPETEALKTRGEDPGTLSRILARTAWDGVIVLDTKGDLEALTRNALLAADRVILPVSDRGSLNEAGKALALLAAERRADRAKVLFTLVDARTRVEAGGSELLAVLEREVAESRWPRFRTHLSRSPRAEALISAGGVPLSVLHHARGTALHRQMRELAEEVLRDLGVDARGPETAHRAPRRVGEPRGRAVGDWKLALLRGLRGR